MLECDAQPAALVAHSKMLINSYLFVTETHVMHMKTAGWTYGQLYIVYVIHEMDTVCLNVMHNLQRLLTPASC